MTNKMQVPGFCSRCKAPFYNKDGYQTKLAIHDPQIGWICHACDSDLLTPNDDFPFCVRDWVLSDGDLLPGDCETFRTMEDAREYFNSLDGRKIALIQLFDDRDEVVDSKGNYRASW